MLSCELPSQFLYCRLTTFTSPATLVVLQWSFLERCICTIQNLLYPCCRVCVYAINCSSSIQSDLGCSSAGLPSRKGESGQVLCIMPSIPLNQSPDLISPLLETSWWICSDLLWLLVFSFPAGSASCSGFEQQVALQVCFHLKCNFKHSLNFKALKSF